MAQTVKCLSTTWETQVQFLGQEDPLEKAMAPHSSTLTWKIPWAEEPGRLQSTGSRRDGHDFSDFTFTFHFHALEEKMATHSSILAWEIAWIGESGALWSIWGRKESNLTPD